MLTAVIAPEPKVKLLAAPTGHIKLLAERVSEGQSLLAITTLYSEESTHTETLRVTKFLAETLGPEVDVQISEWTFGELEHLRPGTIATELAGQTDVLLLATTPQDDLPISIRKWIAFWLKQARPGRALVCLVGSPNDRCPVWPATTNLRNACAHAGVAFFASSFHSESACDAPPEPEPEVVISAHFSLIDVSHWGINE